MDVLAEHAEPHDILSARSEGRLSASPPVPLQQEHSDSDSAAPGASAGSDDTKADKDSVAEHNNDTAAHLESHEAPAQQLQAPELSADMRALSWFQSLIPTPSYLLMAALLVLLVCVCAMRSSVQPVAGPTAPALQPHHEQLLQLVPQLRAEVLQLKAELAKLAAQRQQLEVRTPVEPSPLLSVLDAVDQGVQMASEHFFQLTDSAWQSLTQAVGLTKPSGHAEAYRAIVSKDEQQREDTMLERYRRLHGNL